MSAPIPTRARGTLATICAVLVALIAAGCGGGGGGGGGSGNVGVTPSTVANSVAVTIDGGPTNNVNMPFVSVTVCPPGTSASSPACQVVDHVLLDTGSSGLRLVSSVLNSSLVASLTPVNDGSGNPMAECMQFASGYTWGPLKRADVRMAGEVAASAVIQLIGDPAYSGIVPSSCSSSGPANNTVNTLGANGILGVSVFAQDCGTACVTTAFPGLYYSCSNGSCTPVTATLDSQAWNPVALFPQDNNGTVITLQSVGMGGALSASGTLLFGIGSQSNNALGSATVIGVNGSGDVTTTSASTTYTHSYFDSGSNGMYFGSGVYPSCTLTDPGFYCPATNQTVSATVQGSNGINASYNFTVGNADTFFAANPSTTAWPGLAGSASGSTFGWGLPFFYGRTVFTALEQQPTPAGAGPFVGIR